MTINLITYASQYSKDTEIAHEGILNELERSGSVNIIDSKEVSQLTRNDFCLVFIASGGVERKVMKDFELLPRPVVMLADGNSNSLAATLEISAWFRSRGLKSEILHGDNTSVIERIKLLYGNFMAQQKLSGSRIGVIGQPSSWLIASNVDYLLAKRRWGIEHIHIPLERVQTIFESISDNEVGEACAEFAGKALACKEGSPEDILKAMRLYKAIKRICTEENLQAVTVSCLKLIDLTGTTGCLALSLLNDEGIIAGCEGDLQSIFTMLAAKTLTGETGFMANPTQINTINNEIILTHCTIGINQTEQYIIRNHFETGIGIAIQGLLPIGEVTILKCGGEALDEYFVASGFLTENTNYVNMCRTQVRIRLDANTDYFLKRPLASHHIMIQGNHVNILHEFLSANSCKRIE